MATQNVRILPYINQSVRITAKFWEYRGGYYHKGVDLSRSGYPILYSMLNGTVIVVHYDGEPGSPASYFGNYAIVKDDISGIATLYAHMNSISVTQGQSILIGQPVGVQGDTGDAQGVHLHLEMQDLSNRNWRYNGSRSDYINPAEWIGYNEIIGDYLYYDGTPVPPTPTNPRKSRFPWVLYARKLRDKRT